MSYCSREVGRLPFSAMETTPQPLQINRTLAVPHVPTTHAAIDIDFLIHALSVSSESQRSLQINRVAAPLVPVENATLGISSQMQASASEGAEESHRLLQIKRVETP